MILQADPGRSFRAMEEEIKTAGDLIAKHEDQPLVTLYAEELVSHAIASIRKFGISQIPVKNIDGFVGSIDESKLFSLLVDNPELRNAAISTVMNAPFPVVKESASLEEVSRLINKDTSAVLVEKNDGKFHIITKFDIISALS